LSFTEYKTSWWYHSAFLRDGGGGARQTPRRLSSQNFLSQPRPVHLCSAHSLHTMEIHKTLQFYAYNYSAYYTSRYISFHIYTTRLGSISTSCVNNILDTTNYST